MYLVNKIFFLIFCSCGKLCNKLHFFIFWSFMCIFHWYKQIDQIRKLSKRYREPLYVWEQSVCQEMACCFIMTDTWYDWVVFIIPYLLKEKIGSLKNWMLFPYSQKRGKGNKLKILLGWQGKKEAFLVKLIPHS